MDKRIERSAFIFLLLLPVIHGVAYISLLLLFFWAIRSHKVKYIPLKPYVYVLLGTVVLSCILSTNKLISLGALVVFLCYLLSFVVFANLKKSDLLSEDKLITAIVLSGIIITVIGIVQYFTKTTSVIDYKCLKISPYSSTLGNANRFAKYLVLVTPIGVASLLSIRTLKLKMLSFIFIPLAFLSLWITQSVAGMGATLITILIVLWVKNKWSTIIIITCVIGICGMNYKKVRGFTVHNTCPEIRINTWKYLVPEIIKSYPITGCGLGTYKETAKKYYEDKRFLRIHAHNMYANYVCETGILGLIAFLSFLWGFFYYSIKSFKAHKNNWLQLGGISAIVGLLIHGMVETCIDYLPIGLMFFTIMGIVVGAGGDDHSSQERQDLIQK